MLIYVYFLYFRMRFNKVLEDVKKYTRIKSHLPTKKLDHEKNLQKPNFCNLANTFAEIYMLYYKTYN